MKWNWTIHSAALPSRSIRSTTHDVEILRARGHEKRMKMAVRGQTGIEGLTLEGEGTGKNLWREL
jgi:hypothetical protein